jgi:LysR family transcriptional regulator, hydrogen peroxide-inducible genes activator
MSIRHLNIRDLAYLCAVAEHRHFGRAAHACAITQPALSERVRRIEDALDAVIFERTRRSVLLTPTGREIVDRARRLLDEADEIDAVAHARRAPLSGTFRLALIATLGPYLIPHLLRGLRKEFPQLQLRLAEGLTEGLLDELTAGTHDAVLAALPIRRRQLRAEPLFFEPFWLAAPRDHRLALKTSVTSRELRGEEMLLLQEGHCLSGQALDVCPSGRRANVARLQSTGLETLRHMVASGTRYTLLPWLAVGDEPPLQEHIHYRPLRDKRVGRTIAIVWRAAFARQRDIESFVGFVTKHLPDGLHSLGDEKISGKPDHRQ